MNQEIKGRKKNDRDSLINPTVQMSSLHRNTQTKDQLLNIQPTPTNRITTGDQQDKILTWPQLPRQINDPSHRVT
jgi:hypothetical protein